MTLSKYVQDIILDRNSKSWPVHKIVSELQNSYSAYTIRKFLKSQPGIFVPPKPNPNPPVDQVTTYKIINMYDELLPLTEQQIKKYKQSHRKPKKRKYTQRDLAAKFNLSQATIHTILHANRQVDVMRRKAIRHTEEDKAHIRWKKQRIKKKNTRYISRKRGPKPLQITPEQFWQSVNKENNQNCWIWQGAKDKQGYGRCRWGEEENTKYAMTSRISASLVNPPLIPNIYAPERIKLTCANPKTCCNPAHMRVLSATKPRIRHKIKLEEAKFILRQVTQNIKTKEELSKELNIKQDLIDRIINNPELVRKNLIKIL